VEVKAVRESEQSVNLAVRRSGRIHSSKPLKARAIPSILFLVGMLISSSSAQDVSIDQLKSAAEKGDPVAQCSLFADYLLGRGVPQDYKEALFWGRKSANQGYAPAEAGIGIDYASKKDDTQAAIWLRRAADQGDSDGQLALADLDLRNGNRIAALNWYLSARPKLSGDDLTRANQVVDNINNTLTSSERAQIADIAQAKEQNASAVDGLVVVGIEQGDTLSVRSGPGTKYSEVAKLPSGTRNITAVGSTMVGASNWIHIQVDNTTGWVNGKYVGPASLNQ